jgi:hypothetical protein
MPDSERLQAAVASAEQAAIAGDFSAAAQYLRDALALQEAELGRSHPDVASTLNNLGVVCERTGNAAEAERCYRRACEIVSAAFPPEHPFVQTSRQNLAAFCESHHVSLEPPAPAPPEPIAPPTPAPPIQEREPPAPTSRSEPPPRVARNATAAPPEAGPRVWPMVGGGVVLLVVLLGLWLRQPARDNARATSTTPATMPTPESSPAVTSTPAAHPPAAAPPPSSTPAPVSTPASSRPAARTNGDAPVLVHAELCRTLRTGADWACERPGDPVSPGAIYFYTRLTSSHDTTVVHRWYRNDRLQQSRELKISANAGPGYRTYSRITIDSGESGDWRVELATTDGRVIQQERFVVR